MLSGQIHVVVRCWIVLFDVPSLASVSASLFLVMFACALTLDIVVG